MGSKSNNASLALFFLLNLLFFAFASAQCAPPPPPPPPPTPTPSPPPPTPSPSTGTCPIDAIKLGVCVNVLRGLLNITVGTPPVTPCCSLFDGVVEFEAALCFCTVIKATTPLVINVPLALSLLVNVCKRNAPTGFQCP